MPPRPLQPSVIDPIDRAHLTGRTHPSPPIARYEPAPELRELISRYWVPVWSTPPGRPLVQRTLQHPNALVVVSNVYARFYGVARGLSTVTLADDGWAFGTMLRPGTGWLIHGRPMTELLDAYLDLGSVRTIDGVGIREAIRSVMSPDPSDPANHAAAQQILEDGLRPLLPVDANGLLLNEIVEWVHAHPEVVRVTEVASRFAMSERSLQRLLETRLGLTPKWLIQRRRAQDAVARLKAGVDSLAALAHDLGYADQAHFGNDFRDVTGMTPGEYAADQP